MLWLKRNLVPILLGGLAVAGLSLPVAVSVAAAGTEPVDGSSTTVVESADAPDSTAQTAQPTDRRSTNDTIQLVTKSLLAIAVATALMAIVFFWYTMPSRRLRLADKGRIRPKHSGD